MFDVEKVIEVYKKEYLNFGFIPAPRLRRDYEKGRFFFNADGWILIGSPKSKVTPIYAVYVYPERRNGNTNKVKTLLSLLPNKSYRVRCYFGETFWKKVGLKKIRVENKNTRKRDITILEGSFIFDHQNDPIFS